MPLHMRDALSRMEGQAYANTETGRLEAAGIMDRTFYLYEIADAAVVSFEYSGKEETFEDFLEFISRSLDLNVDSFSTSQCRRRAEIPYLDTVLVAACHRDCGYSLRIPRNSAVSATGIVIKCRGSID